MSKRSTETLRIIGGQWRSRHISFPDLPGLRPTQDQVRETLFNWLTPYIKGASCLDLFAGSGALGFEALSRGAKQVSFVDKHRKAIAVIESNAMQLEAKGCEIIVGECPSRIPPLTFSPYDLVFLDPPFHQGLLSSSAEWLEHSGYLNDEAYVYIEAGKRRDAFSVPSNWQIHKTAKTSRVVYYLYLRRGLAI